MPNFFWATPRLKPRFRNAKMSGPQGLGFHSCVHLQVLWEPVPLGSPVPLIES